MIQRNLTATDSCLATILTLDERYRMHALIRLAAFGLLLSARWALRQPKTNHRLIARDAYGDAGPKLQQLLKAIALLRRERDALTGGIQF